MDRTSIQHRRWTTKVLSKVLGSPVVRRWLLPPALRRATSNPRDRQERSLPVEPVDVWKATHGHGGTRPRIPPKPQPSPRAKAPTKKKGGRRLPRAPKGPSEGRQILVVDRRSLTPAPTPTPALGAIPSSPQPQAPPSATPTSDASSQARPVIEIPSPAPAPTPKAAPEANPFASWSKKDIQDRIRELVGDIEIPRFRKAVFETLRRLRDPDTTPQKLMEVMAIDGELVGKVMNTVNSTAYSPRSRIQSLDHAILLMGNADLERIVMMVGAKAALPQQTHPKFALSTFWKASSRRAVLAREIADLVQPSKANLSFTAGFLQDLSVPLIVTSKKDQYVSLFNTALEEKRDLHLLEAETLGWDHAELGALVALNWELPDDVTLCLKDHNHPESASRPDPAYFVSSLLPSHGEEWHSHFATRVNDRYVVAPEVLDSICKDSIQKANDLAKLF